MLEQPFLLAGGYSAHRGRRHGAPSRDLPGDRFVVCAQNHDQVGNRARGDRLGSLVGPPRARLAGDQAIAFEQVAGQHFLDRLFAERRGQQLGGRRVMRALDVEAIQAQAIEFVDRLGIELLGRAWTRHTVPTA